MLDFREELTEARAAKGDLDQRLERLEAEKADLLALKNELSRNVEAKDEELARVRSTAEELEEKMKAEIAKGDIRLSQAGGRLRVDLVDKVLFDSGEARISPKGEEVLARVGAVLAHVEGKLIQVSGHTDDSPISSRLVSQYPTNWELSVSRATNVVRFLAETAHVPAKRLVAAGYGPFQPVASNATAGGRARNRRIEILLTPAFEPEPSQGVAAEVEEAAPAGVAVKAPAPAKGGAKPAPATTPSKDGATRVAAKRGAAKPAAKAAPSQPVMAERERVRRR
jgi:chemotaxis protein MotB